MRVLQYCHEGENEKAVQAWILGENHIFQYIRNHLAKLQRKTQQIVASMNKKKSTVAAEVEQINGRNCWKLNFTSLALHP